MAIEIDNDSKQLFAYDSISGKMNSSAQGIFTTLNPELGEIV